MILSIQAIKEYIYLKISREADSIFMEERLMGIGKSNRKKVIRIIEQYCFEKVSKSPSVPEIVAICRAVLVLFPSLRENQSNIGGIVCIFYAVLY